jgi:hypothetical protein
MDSKKIEKSSTKKDKVYKMILASSTFPKMEKKYLTLCRKNQDNFVLFLTESPNLYSDFVFLINKFP